MKKPIQSVGKSTLPIYHFTTLKRFHALMHESPYCAYPPILRISLRAALELHLHRSCSYIGAAPTSKLRAASSISYEQATNQATSKIKT